MNTNKNKPVDPLPDPTVETNETVALKALIDVYLIAGLSPYDAVRSALADYECHLHPVMQVAA